mmetsp:Transcript_64656/g.185927  ORF Transcript_64656/g.185927 Transcript_64656/m.185927 type:complete len:1248 (-) Transcript_64656:64-3807(-)
MASFFDLQPLTDVVVKIQLLATAQVPAVSTDAWLAALGVAVAGAVVGWRLARRFTVPFDADRYFPLTEPEEEHIHGAFAMCEQIKDHTTRCYFKGRIREMVRVQPICDADEFAKMSEDLRAEVDDCVHFGTCFRYAGPAVKWDISRLPPGPPPLYAGYEMVKDLKRMHRVLCRFSRQYGKVFPMQLEGNPLWVVVSGAKEAKAIFHDNGATVSSRAFGQAHLIAHTDFPSGNFLRCPFSEDLKKRRGVCWREALSKQKVELFRPILEHCRHISLRSFLCAADTGEAFLPRPFLRMSYLNTLACILFGISFADVDDPEYRRVYSFVDGEASEDLAGAADILPILRLTPLHTQKAERMKGIRAREDAWLHERIGERRRHLADGGEPQTLCDILLGTLESPCPGQRLSYENVKEICNEIIFAGTDTTATTTETVLAHLLNNPDKAEALREELDAVLGDGARLPTAADFSHLPYLNACIREAMRLTCAVPFNGHACSEDTEVLGYRIPKGAMCINNIYAVHYDPEIYPEPDKFLPERWLDKDPCRWSVENDFEFMPFGIGRRLCIGYNLALENIQLFVASLFSSFRFSTEGGRPVSTDEIMEFTVSLPEFKVLAEVREGSALALRRKEIAELPTLELQRLGVSRSEEHAAATPATHVAPAAGQRWAVWYASQMGTAETFALAVARMARRRGVECRVRDLVKATASGLCPDGESAAILLVATYGSGEPTDSALDFWKRLQSGNIAVHSTRYAVFGLGNSSYEHYNAMGRQVDARLEALGGLRLEDVPLGLGDASMDLDAAFDDWLRALLARHAPAAEAVKAPPMDAGAGVAYHSCGAWRVRWQAKATAPRQLPKADGVVAVAAGVRELTRRPEISGSVVEVDLDFSGHGLTYETADTIAVLPRNDPRCVEMFGAALNQPLDAEFTLEATGNKATELPFPCPTTLREVLASAVDLLGRPSRQVVTELAQHCGDAAERERLLHLAGAGGKGDWEDLAAKGRLSLLEIFGQYPSLAAMPLAAFVELVPQVRLRPRHYTASSCPAVVGEGRALLTVKVLPARAVDCNGVLARFGGVASSYLAGLCPGDELRVFSQPSNFALPADPATPVIMIAAGTGIAPFRGFLQQRRLMLKQGVLLGRAMLFFGCTRSDVDFICEDELARHLREGSLSDLVTAFSREDSQRKVYVQHRLQEQAATLRELILSFGGHVYVCGGTAMGRAAKEAVTGALLREAQCDAEQYVSEMERERRYVAELWA